VTETTAPAADTTADTTTGSTTGRPGLLTAYRVLAGLCVLIVLVQAALAGRHLSLGAGIELHGILGNIVFTLAVVMVVLSFLTQTRGVVVGHAVAFAALCFAQVGLGYVGRDTAEAAAWHIPNGVLLMGLAVAHLSLILPGRN